MINLLPAVAKKRVLSEYWARIGALWIGMLSVLSVILMILLIPVYFLIYSQINSNLAAANAATSEVNRYDVSASTLVKASQRANLLLQTEKIASFTAAVDTIRSAQSEGITVTSFDLNRQAKSFDLAPIAVSGRATTRQELASFRERLLKLPNISTVELPITNLVKNQDITFSITITLATTTTTI